MKSLHHPCTCTTDTVKKTQLQTFHNEMIFFFRFGSRNKKNKKNNEYKKLNIIFLVKYLFTIYTK